jgi:UDP-2,3-diacylglucosamine pyrophosphatase LpxH
MGIKDLDALLIKSERIEIDDSSKIVILSDVHRGDGTYADSLISNRNIYFAALRHYYNESFTLIEAGDGDELWKNKNYIDIAYNYKGVFRMLNRFNKENRLYMLYGNHDRCKSSKDFINKQIKKLKRVEEGFGADFIILSENIEYKEGIVLKYVPENKEIFIFHGHQVDFWNFELAFISRFLVRYFWKSMEGIGGFKAPTRPANSYKKDGNMHTRLEEWAQNNNKCIICGHTHKSRFPKPGEGLYFNDGCCVLPCSMTAIEISNGEICLVKWSTYVREDNSLYIVRNLVSKSEKLEKYFEYIN